MKLALIGVTGKVGKRISDEALRRGHAVTGIARDVSKGESREGLTLRAGDAQNPDALAPLIASHDVVISSTPFTSTESGNLIEAVKVSGVNRYLVVGGAGSLDAEPGTLLLDTPDFKELPAWIQTEAIRGKAFLDVLRSITDLDWTMLSPSAHFVEGERTGSFRVGSNELLTAADGKSWITYEDFSIALLDEVEHPQHIRERFTVGY